MQVMLQEEGSRVLRKKIYILLEKIQRRRRNFSLNLISLDTQKRLKSTVCSDIKLFSFLVSLMLKKVTSVKIERSFELKKIL